MIYYQYVKYNYQRFRRISGKELLDAEGTYGWLLELVENFLKLRLLITRLDLSMIGNWTQTFLWHENSISWVFFDTTINET